MKTNQRGIDMNERAANISPWLRPVVAWCESEPIRLCVLFGSQATGQAHARSDVDLAVWPQQPATPAQKLRWLVDLQNLLDREISLVIVSPALDPVLGIEIVRNGRILYEGEPDLWFNEKSRLWRLYDDSLPFRRAALKQIKQFVKEQQDGA